MNDATHWQTGIGHCLRIVGFFNYLKSFPLCLGVGLSGQNHHIFSQIPPEVELSGASHIVMLNNQTLVPAVIYKLVELGLNGLRVCLILLDSTTMVFLVSSISVNVLAVAGLVAPLIILLYPRGSFLNLCTFPALSHICVI